MLTTSAFAMDESEKYVTSGLVPHRTSFTDIPQEVRSLIIGQVAYEQFLDKIPMNLAFVCREWFKIIQGQMKVNEPNWKAWHGVIGHEDIYQQFLNVRLIYRPDPHSDKGMIQLKTSNLNNPLEGTFDLSKCGNAAQYLSISTGYRKGMKQENSNKLEIWFVPRFVIEKHINSLAGHFKRIRDDWEEETAPICILWTWGGWTDLCRYDYRTTSVNDISSKNLFQNWADITAFQPRTDNTPPSRLFRYESMRLKKHRLTAHFTLTFEPKNGLLTTPQGKNLGAWDPT